MLPSAAEVDQRQKIVLGPDLVVDLDFQVQTVLVAVEVVLGPDQQVLGQIYCQTVQIVGQMTVEVVVEYQAVGAVSGTVEVSLG